MNNLDSSLLSIGIQLHSSRKIKKEWINVEETILKAIHQAKKDRKILSLILSWVDLYGDRLIAEKFIKIYKKMDISKDEQIFFNIFFIYITEIGDRRFKAFAKKLSRKKLFRDDHQSALDLKGPDPIFKKYNILVPQGFIKISQKNILPRGILIKKNLVIKNRYLFGANWRSDIISAIQLGMKNPFQIKNTIGCSYDSAYRTFRDYQLAVA